MYGTFSDKCIIVNFGVQYIEKFGQEFSTYCTSKFQSIAFSVRDVCDQLGRGCGTLEDRRYIFML